MVKVIESQSHSFVFGSSVSKQDCFSFGKAKNHESHGKVEQKLLYKGDDFKLLFDANDSKFIFGEAEADSFSAKGDYLSISDYAYTQHDELLAAADLQSKCMLC